MTYHYSRYIGHVCQHPWAITPDKFLAITELMRERLLGHRPTDEEIVARLGDDMQAVAQTAQVEAGAVAVIPIHGFIAFRANTFEASSGGTSSELIGRMVDRVGAAPDVTSVLLDINSPGGSVEGIPELAVKIARLAKVKPVIAHVNSLAASAAYWLATQANEIVSTPSGMAGSIGVFLIHTDDSEKQKKEGIKTTIISFGDNKLAPGVPLSDELRAHLQVQVDAMGREFVAAVAKGRGVSVAEVKKSFGQGLVFNAKQALSVGMVDRIATMDDTLARMVSGRRSGRRAVALAEQPRLALADDVPSNLIDELHEHSDGALVEKLRESRVEPPAVSDLAEEAAARDAVNIAAALSES